MKTGQSIAKSQRGFTLVEIAIVLVIIGLLLGGVLKGQELINSAKVKNFANDFRNVPLYIYAYQDKFRALPGDDKNVVANLPTGATLASGTGQTPGNGNINGNWDSTTLTEESALFWQHVRLAGLTTGATTPAATGYFPTNADGGRIGVESSASDFISTMTGAYLVCSTGIQGRFAKQLDITMDDGVSNTGSMRVVATNHTRGAAAPAPPLVDDTTYTVCMAL